MTPNQYQQAAVNTAIYPEEVEWSYLPLKLAGEAGEVAEKIGKAFRKYGADWQYKVDEEFWDGVIKELGDVQWYIAVMAAAAKRGLDEVMQLNLEKLNSRKDRGVLEGNGDSR